MHRRSIWRVRMVVVATVCLAAVPGLARHPQQQKLPILCLVSPPMELSRRIRAWESARRFISCSTQTPASLPEWHPAW